MTHKRFGLVALVVLFVSALLAQQAIKPGVRRWPIKTGLPEHINKTPKAIDYATFANLGNMPGVTKNDKRYQAARIPDKIDDSKYKEGDIVAVKGYIHLVALEPDGDYHIQVNNDATDGKECIIVEIPNPDKAFVSDDSVRATVAAPRDFVTEKLLKGNSVKSSGNVMQHPPYVRIVGQLFYDDSHVGDAPRGKKGMKATTLWEVHPVTAMAFAQKPKQQ